MGRAVADEYVTRAEFNYRLESMKERVDGVAQQLGQKVPLDSWNIQNTHVAADLAELDRDCRERHEGVKKDIAAVNKRIDDRGNKTWTRVLGVVSIAVALLVGILGAYISSKGIK